MGSRQVTLKVVFDTNSVISALVFGQGRLAWLRQAWASGTLVPLVCTQTAQELLRVLAYPKFGLTKDEMDELLGDFLPFAEIVEVVEEDYPTCRDPDDRVFLALAEQAGADAMVTGDDDLLALKEDFPIPILTPAELKDFLRRQATP